MPGMSLRQPETFEDVQRAGWLEMFAASPALGWQGIIAHHFAGRPQSSAPVERVVLCDSFALHVAGVPNYLRRRWDGRWDTGYSVPHMLCIQPGSAPSEYGVSEHAENLMFGISADLKAAVLADIGKGDADHHQTQERFLFRDPLVEQIGWTLIQLLHDADDAARLYAESLGVSLAHHLLRFYSLTHHPLSSKAPAISQTQIRLTLDYLHAHYAQPIQLAELAQIAGLSVTHFARQFRQATAYSPHQYLVRLRCEQAYKLLMMGKYTVTTAAQAVGFYDHSHLVRHFKRIYGISPAALLAQGSNIHRPQ